ncbi:MAG: hypothetical protein IJ773_05740 [Lachnospiraceae bacterium]|nr:hypothetical protein [Lachnospiraceae bacterium]
MEKSSHRFAAGFLLFLLVELIYAVSADFASYWISYLIHALTLLCFCLLLTSWGMSVKDRLLPGRLRRILMVGIGAMFFWVILRTNSYRLAIYTDELKKLWWYAYVIPEDLLAVLFLFSCLHVGKDEHYRIHPGWHVATVVTGLFILLYLTNDLHGLVYRLKENFSRDNGSLYEREIGCYLNAAWVGMLMLTGVALCLRAHRSRHVRNRIWIPLAALLASGLYILIREVTESPFAFIRFPEAVCVMMVLTWESMIQIHAFPHNDRYQFFFSQLPEAVQLCQEDGKIVLESGRPFILTAKEREMARTASLEKGDLRFKGKNVTGGEVYWAEDLSTINRMNESLEAAVEQLSGENELLKAETALKEQKARVEEQKKIYEEAEKAVKTQLQAICHNLETITPQDPQMAEKLPVICTRGAYVKRRVNLFLLSEEKGKLPGLELVFSLKELLSYLSLCRVDCFLNGSLMREYPKEILLTAFDFVEELLERTWGSVKTVLFALSEDKGLRLRAMLEFTETETERQLTAMKEWLLEKGAAGRPGERFALDSMWEEETLYLTFIAGGETHDSGT